MQAQQQFVFTFFGSEGRSYSFTIPAATQREALEKLAADFGMIIGEIEESVVQ